MKWLVLLLVGCRFHAGAAPLDAGAVVDDVPLDDTVIASDVPIDVPVAPTPILYVQGSSTQAADGATTVAVAYAGSQTAGNLNVVVVSHFTTASVATVVDVAGNTYTLLNVATSGTQAQDVYYAQNIKVALAGNNTVTAAFSQATNQPTLRIVEYSGIATTNALDNSGIVTGVGTTADSGPVVTTHAHDLIFGADTSSQTTTGPGSMFTQRMITAGDILEDREVLVAGTYNATAPINPSASWVMVLAAFKGLP